VKIRQPWILLGVPVFGAIIAYNLKTGIAYSRGRVVYEATDPDAFWMNVFSAGLFILLTLFIFFIAQAGDGWNDDG